MTKGSRAALPKHHLHFASALRTNQGQTHLNGERGSSYYQQPIQGIATTAQCDQASGVLTGYQAHIAGSGTTISVAATEEARRLD